MMVVQNGLRAKEGMTMANETGRPNCLECRGSGIAERDPDGAFSLECPVCRGSGAEPHELDRAIAIAWGCLDYGGGYRGDEGKLDAFHHGISTVIRALEAARDNPDTQVWALERIGSAAIRAAEGEGEES
jgi:hypothetical protein